MKRRIQALICLLLGLLLLPGVLSVSAIESLDPDAPASLDVIYQREEFVFPDLSISIYRVARALPDGSFELIEPFASYPVNIHGITSQEQWRHVASTLASYVIADQVAPDCVEITDEEGIASFDSLTTGLYLVCETVAENERGTWVFQNFMVYLPTPLPDGGFDYEIEAIPKCSEFTPKTEYRVTKLWKDAGIASRRPTEITVDIFRNGVLHESQTLSAQNDWTYVWYVTGEDSAIWTVTERMTEEESEYTVTIQQNGAHFTIINESKIPPDDPEVPDSPQTGDSTIMIASASLILMSMVALGLSQRRRRGA